jgi:small subunit ribosomal protein S6
MPRYELMYILSSAVSDDQVPQTNEQISKIVSDFGGTDIQLTDLGKKKLAYPIKRTRNGYYIVVDFTIPTDKINELDAKIRTQENTIIRYLIVNQDEHLERLARDREIQTKLQLNRPQPLPGEAAAPPPMTAKPARVERPALVMNAAELDQKIEEALNEEIIP